MIEVSVLAGGCFWGVEYLIAKLDGVLETKVGYCGGNLKNPRYEDVKKGNTGHAESVWIKFDNSKLKYLDLLNYFFRIHDPTTKDRQQNDIGSQYRSVIFYLNEEQRELAYKAIEIAKKNWGKDIVTQVIKFKKFYDAEDYHQKYLWKNPSGYICHFERKFDKKI